MKYGRLPEQARTQHQHSCPLSILMPPSPGCWLGHLTRKNPSPRPNMICNVFGGTLNLALSIALHHLTNDSCLVSCMQVFFSSVLHRTGAFVQSRELWSKGAVRGGGVCSDTNHFTVRHTHARIFGPTEL